MSKLLAISGMNKKEIKYKIWDKKMNSKKINFSRMILALSILTFALSGCGKNNQETDISSDDISVQDSLWEANVENTSNAPGVKYGSEIIYLNEQMDEVLQRIGEPEKYEEAESCLYNGMDKSYTYDSMIINTYPMHGIDYISSIEIIGAGAEILDNAAVGDSVDSILTYYDENDLIMIDMYYMYETEGYGIVFYRDGDVIKEIEIYYIDDNAGC